MLYDVAIIGAGPAGSSAAIALASSGARVLLLERGRFPRHKVCGEFVSAESLGLLRSLVGSAFDSAIAITRSRLFIDGRVVAAKITPPAASITRYDLDFALWNRAHESGAECRSGHEVNLLVSGAEHFTLRTSTDAFTARAVIDATGRWSRLRDDTAPPGPKWIGLKCHFRESSDAQAGTQNTERDATSVDLYFFDQGYCGVQPIAPGVVNACAMVRADRATTLNEVFTLHAALARRALTWTQIFEPITTAPLVFRVPRPVRYISAVAAEARNESRETTRGTQTVDTDNWKPILCIGDAAAFIDPFAGDGISLAVRTGVASGEALVPFLRDTATLRESANTYASRYETEFAPVLRSAARVRRLLDKPRLLRTAALTAMRVPFVADYVIRKTRTA